MPAEKTIPTRKRGRSHGTTTSSLRGRIPTRSAGASLARSRDSIREESSRGSSEECERTLQLTGRSVYRGKKGLVILALNGYSFPELTDVMNANKDIRKVCEPQYPFEWNFELSSPDLRRQGREKLNEEKLDKQNKLLRYLADKNAVVVIVHTSAYKLKGHLGIQVPECYKPPSFLLNTLLGNNVIQALQRIKKTMLIMYCDGAYHHVPEANQSFDDFLKQKVFRHTLSFTGPVKQIMELNHEHTEQFFTDLVVEYLHSDEGISVEEYIKKHHEDGGTVFEYTGVSYTSSLMCDAARKKCGRVVYS